MRHIACFVVVFLLVSGTCLAAEDASTPSPRSDGNWMSRHEGFVRDAQKQGDADLLFLGDSITDFWRNSDRGAAVWEKYYGKLKAVNYGISGDRTQHVLWRITNGELDGIRPKVVILMIGTNNLGGDSAQVIGRGVAAILKEIEARLPHSKVLLLGIFPRGQSAGDGSRKTITQINTMLADYDDHANHRYLDFGAKFLEPDGSISKEIMTDYLHPGPKGYEIWAQAMQPTLDEMLKSAKPARP